MRLEGKVAAITGGARGFGAAAAKLFAAEGGRVVIGDLRDDLGMDVVTEIREAGGEAEFVRADVTSAADMKAMVAKAEDAFGKLDVLVANAGIRLPKAVDEFTEADFDAQIGINVKGTWLAITSALPALRRNGGGSIVVTASGAALRGSDVSVLYSASKGAVLMLGKSVALQTARENIRCNIVCPGPVGNDFYLEAGQTGAEYSAVMDSKVPMGHTGDNIDIAQAMLYFASDESKFCTGSVLSVDGGFVI